ncbi:hypothetical protein QLX08_009720 [Tetragonisca angustula]|uniref:Uncharacterized protein n=1 Tax=Tetragonisca angustula TaxID=166442 RepID=A0AAW0ZFF3_9HYME
MSFTGRDSERERQSRVSGVASDNRSFCDRWRRTIASRRLLIKLPDFQEKLVHGDIERASRTEMQLSFGNKRS